MFDFAGKRWWYLSISAVLFVVFGGALVLWRLEPGIEFTSGSSFTVEFTEQAPSQSDIHSALSDLGHPEARVQGSGTNQWIIRTDELEVSQAADAPTGPAEPTQGEIDTIEAGLRERFGAMNRIDFSTVSGTVSSEIAWYSFWAVIAASAAILVYISLAFRRLPRPWRYGTCAVVAVLHDAVIILGLFAILGEFNGTEVDTAFITALLTIIGFSVHDTIVVFDRIREKVQQDPYVPYEEAVNASMMETLARSINTSFVVVLTVVSMLLIGGDTIRNFLLVLLVGILSGTYSSIGIASQLLVAWENNDIGRFFRRITGKGDTPAAVEAA
ncbi:MAG: protein translocase subunit SecF [Dehalococcoidia bacterium]|nr:protein translocase subunit SecF [Dehalococcoidia bacterium]